MKTITFIGINFYPEDTAIGIYSTQMVEFLIQSGYKVNVITGFPYYPQWKIKEDYQNKPTFFTEIIEGVIVYRYKQYVPKKPTFLKRIIHLLDFTIGSFINSFKIKQTDLVIAIVPFTSTIFLGWFLKKRLKAKLWTHIQDFEFDAALQSGVSKKGNNLLFRVLYGVERVLLNTSDFSSTISESMLIKLKTKTNSSTFYFPNWIIQDPVGTLQRKKHQYLKSNKFKILYSGSIGDKQNWEFFIDFLKEVKQFNDVEVCIVGQGTKKEWLLSNLTDFDFVNVHNPVPLNELNDLLYSADLHILFQKDTVLDTVMPSKILGMMASGKPSLIAGHLESEVSKIITISQGGIYLSNSITLVLEAFNKLYFDKKLREEMGVKAHKYVVENYDSVNILSNFEHKLQLLLNSQD